MIYFTGFACFTLKTDPFKGSVKCGREAYGIYKLNFDQTFNIDFNCLILVFGVFTIFHEGKKLLLIFKKTVRIKTSFFGLFSAQNRGGFKE